MPRRQQGLRPFLPTTALLTARAQSRVRPLWQQQQPWVRESVSQHPLRETGIGLLTQGLSPRLVKVDAKLKSFVPATLRVKRPAGTIEKAPAKFQKSEDTTSVNVKNNEAAASGSVHVNSVDDAYADFMDEINQLAS